jgi:hypothetical protein
LNRWNALLSFYAGSDEYRRAFKSFFWGAHMISRAFESAIVGGVIPESAMEDGLFGMEMEVYARQIGKRVGEEKDTLLAITALRESQRTSSSFGRAYSQMDSCNPVFVDDPVMFLKGSKVRERVSAELENMDIHADKVRAVIESENILLSSSEGDSIALILQDHDVTLRKSTVDKWITDVLSRAFPRIELNRTNYLQFEKEVERLTNGPELIRYLDQMTGKILSLK